MNDSISRQALCEYALNQKDKSITPNDIMRFPSAQPERPKGYIKIEVISMLDGEDLVCENCGEHCLSPSYNFCPKCGIEFIGVRGEQDDND